MAIITSRFTASGALAGLTAGKLSLLLYPATELEAGPCQLWLRTRDDGIRAHPLTGPASGSTAADGVEDDERSERSAGLRPAGSPASRRPA